jgi:general stress protein 26
MKPAAPSTSEESRRHFFELLKKFDTATLVTRRPSGDLHGRPLSLAKRQDDGTLWFVTSLESVKVDEISADSRVLVVMQNANQFIAAQGLVAIVLDRAKIRELWTEAQRTWFKDKEDPDVALLRFSPVEAEFWDNAGALGMKFAFQAAKAMLKREPLADRGDPKAHGKVFL